MEKTYVIQVKEKSDGSFSYGSIAPIEETEIDTIRKTAYEQGAEDMRKALRLLIDCDDDCITIPDIFHAFGEGSYHAVVRKHPAMEIIEKIRQYEQKQEEIKVGDEVITDSGKAVVTGVGPVHFEYVCEDGSHGFDEVKNVKKSGRHFPEIVEVLEKMQGEQDGKRREE